MDSNAVLDILKIIIPALGAWLALWASNRRNHRMWAAKEAIKQADLLSTQSDKLFATYSEMTAQAREIIRTMQVEIIEARTALAGSKSEISRLLSELAEIKQKYAEALRQLESLQTRAPRKRV